MAHPTELAALSYELKEQIPESVFRFEWSSPAQGKNLLLCGDWNRRGQRSSRTIYGRNGSPLKKQKRPLSTSARQEALQEAARLVRCWSEGADTRQRCKRVQEPASNVLAMMRNVVTREIRSRRGGHGSKQKHLRHARSLFLWLDERNQRLDAPGAIQWAGENVKRNTDTYADRLRIAQWACEWNRLPWILPQNKKAQKPTVNRPFVDMATDADLEAAFDLIKDPQAEAYFRVIAATGCRPSEVALFDWDRWESEGRPQGLYGYSPKVEKAFVAICEPMAWVDCVDTRLLKLADIDSLERPVTAQTRELLTINYSRLLKTAKEHLGKAGWKLLPTWTDLRHMWTIRAQVRGWDMRAAALSQAHSPKMAEMVYLRHGEQKQVLAEIERHSRMRQVS